MEGPCTLVRVDGLLASRDRLFSGTEQDVLRKAAEEQWRINANGSADILLIRFPDGTEEDYKRLMA